VRIYLLTWISTIAPQQTKKKGFFSTCKIEQQLCDEKPTNAEIAVFLCRKLLLFDEECGDGK